MDSRDCDRALGHRKTIWIKINPKEQFCSLGYIYGCEGTKNSARVQNLEWGYIRPAATADCIHN